MLQSKYKYFLQEMEAGFFVWLTKAIHNVSKFRGADAVMPVIISTALGIGVVTFLIGYVGPIIFWPEANLGPLLGLFITGPLGFLLGGVIGFWRILSNEMQTSSAFEWGILLIIWLLMMGWYLLFFPFWPLATISLAICQIVTVSGTVILYRQRCRKLKHTVDRRSLSVLIAALLIIGTEFFPPVTHPDWARPQDGYLQDPPAAVFCLDSRLDSSHKVPQLAINRNRLIELWLWVLSINAVAWLVVKPDNSKDEDNNAL